MSAIKTLLHGLIDYAGLYPPAALDMRTAVRNYLDYSSGPHSFALGRFVVDIGRLGELHETAGESVAAIPISAIVPAAPPSREIESIFNAGLRIESVEIKCSEPLNICRFREVVPSRLEQYFEIPVGHGCTAAIDALASVGARAKLRMGGIVPEAFPPADHVVETLRIAANRRVPFKATAGLHHPIRSRHRLTYESDSPCGLMHGFVNFFCAAALVYFGQCGQAIAVLEEEDPAAFSISPDAIAWRSHQWDTEQVRTIRQEFLTSFGSCSFIEPVRDLEALGWL